MTWSTRDLVDKILRLTEERMKQESVVSMDQLRDLRKSSRRTLLIMDDDIPVREALRRILENEGYNVLSAASGAELTDLLDVSAIDGVFLDVGLPWVNGLELARLMRQHDQLKKIPIIFVSGYATKEDIKRGFAAGADDYITKPFSARQVTRSIATLLALS